VKIARKAEFPKPGLSHKKEGKGEIKGKSLHGERGGYGQGNQEGSATLLLRRRGRNSEASVMAVADEMRKKGF